MNISLNDLSTYHIFDMITIILGFIASIWLWKRSKDLESDQLRSYIPTMWTSLGIFFTFVSIYLSLKDYGNENEFLIGDEIKNINIRELIRNIIPAFSTSIIGIFGAIVSTIANRLSIAKTEKREIDKFKEIKERIIGSSSKSDSPELMLLEIVNSIKESGKNTCTKLEGNKSSSEIKFDSISQQIVNLLQLMDSLNSRTNNVISNALDSQREDFNSAIGNIRSVFEQTLNTQHNTFSSKMDDLRRMLHDEIQNIENTNQTLLNRLLDQEKELLKMTTESLFEESKERNEQLRLFITQSEERMQHFVQTENDGIIALYKRIDESITNHIDREDALFNTEIKNAVESFALEQHRLCTSTIEESRNQMINRAGEMLEKQDEVYNAFVDSIQSKLSSMCDSFLESISLLRDNMASRLEEIQNIQLELLERTVETNKSDLNQLLDANKESLLSISSQIVSDNNEFKQNLEVSQQKIKEELVELETSFGKELLSVHEGIVLKTTGTYDKILVLQQSFVSALKAIQTDIVQSTNTFIQKQGIIEDNIVTKSVELSQDIADKIQKSMRINELEAAGLKLSSAIGNCTADLENKLSVIVRQLERTSNAIEGSSGKYLDAVNRSDDMNRYIDGTIELLKEHITVVDGLSISLSDMEKSIKRICDQLANNNSNFHNNQERASRSSKDNK